MLTGIDHVILAVAEPDVAATDLERLVGLRGAGGGRHEAHGTHNRLVWLGDSYIELMGVFDEALAAASWWGSHVMRLLADQGDGYAGIVIASDDLDADAGRLRALGSTLDEPASGQRVRPDGRVVRWRAALPAVPDPDVGLAFLIEHDETAAEWTPAERAARKAAVHPLGTTAALRRVEVSVGDMHAATMRIHRELGVGFRPSLAGGGARDGSLGRQVLRLLRQPMPRARIVLSGGSESREVELFGCRWQVEPAN